MAVAGKFERLWIEAQEWGLNRMDRLVSQRGAMPSHLLTGLRGERAALFELRRRGFAIVANRWTTPKMRGDVDLIAWDEEWLCFIEVKTRSVRDMTPAESAVDEDKRDMIRRLARAYLGGFPEAERRSITVRFDVVSVYLGVEAEFEIFRGAFTW